MIEEENDHKINAAVIVFIIGVILLITGFVILHNKYGIYEKIEFSVPYRYSC